MSPDQQRATLASADCDVRFDNLTRQLYATDASIHRIEPLGVAFPQNAAQAGSVIRAAHQAGVSLTPRGAGTGLVGGAIGDGLILEFSRHNRQITDLNLERRTVRVGAGVVLDQLNAFLKPRGFCFGPDVATSSRATLGGMIANNSSGSHVPVYGTTADHVHSLEIVLADGSIETIGPGTSPSQPDAHLLRSLVRDHAAVITDRMPFDLLKRWPGYGLDRFLRQPDNLSPLLAGSEGTLAAIVSAELKVVPLPRERGVALVFFASVAEAMQATVELLDLKPAAIEHIDRILCDQTKGQLQFKAARDLLELDSRPCESILIVEFFDEAVAERLAAVAKTRLGLRTTILKDSAEANLVWGLRKAGVALLTGCKGSAKPVTGIEDTAVRPHQLPAYVEGLRSLLDPLGLDACFYGHAASGLLHVRPVLDLHSAEDLRKFRRLMNEVAALVRQFKGSLAAEHGVGIARTEFLPGQLGDELSGVMRKVKAAFDLENRFNPGKLIGDGRYACDTNLRTGADGSLALPFTPLLAFAAKDESFVGNLEQCNGCGGCRKESPTMCPTFLATGEEIMSTRGRANIIRSVLEGRDGKAKDPLLSRNLEVALSNCLSCKACTTECPSNVNLALLKAELLHARHQRDGLPMRERLLSSVDLLGKLGCLAPDVANEVMRLPWLRRILSRHLDISERRPLPRYAEERFDAWFAQRGHGEPPRTRSAAVPAASSRGVPPRGAERGETPLEPAGEDACATERGAKRGRVLLWDDTFVRYHEPHIGKAAVAVLEAAGYEVALVHGRRCCGRPAFSQGDLDAAAHLGRHNLQLLANEDAPLLFLEPSCYSMFAEDYQELKLPAAKAVAARTFLFEQFVEDLLRREPSALRFREQTTRVAIHAHCHAKSLLNVGFMARLASRLPGCQVTMLETGCCGMAGAFGALESKYDLSLQVAAPLVDRIRQEPTGTVLVASGTSCRHQIEHLTRAQPLHMAELMAVNLPMCV